MCHDRIVDVREARALLGISPDAQPDEVRAAVADRWRDRDAGDVDPDLDAAARIVEDDIDANGPPVAPRPPEWPRPSMPVAGRAPVRRFRTRTVQRARHRRLTRVDGWRPVAVFLVLLCGLALLVIGLVTGAVAFSSLVWFWVLIPFGVVAVAIVGAVATDTRSRCALVFLALGVLPAIVLGEAIDGSVLFLRGTTVLASITAVTPEYYRSTVTFHYSLAGPSGAALPGGTYDVPGDDVAPHRVGDKVTVVYARSRSPTTTAGTGTARAGARVRLRRSRAASAGRAGWRRPRPALPRRPRGRAAADPG